MTNDDLKLFKNIYQKISRNKSKFIEIISKMLYQCCCCCFIYIIFGVCSVEVSNNQILFPKIN